MKNVHMYICRAISLSEASINQVGAAGRQIGSFVAGESGEGSEGDLCVPWEFCIIHTCII